MEDLDLLHDFDAPINMKNRCRPALGAEYDTLVPSTAAPGGAQISSDVSALGQVGAQDRCWSAPDSCAQDIWGVLRR